MTPRMLLHLEGATVFAVSILAYHWSQGGWPLFVVLFLVPDLSMIGYLANARAGAITYDAVHSYVAPLALAGYSFGANHPVVLAVSDAVQGYAPEPRSSHSRDWKSGFVKEPNIAVVHSFGLLERRIANETTDYQIRFRAAFPVLPGPTACNWSRLRDWRRQCCSLGGDGDAEVWDAGDGIELPWAGTGEAGSFGDGASSAS